jgi:hypothetical protein
MPTTKKKTSKPRKVTKKPTLAELKKTLTKHTDAFCKELLNEEYRSMCRVMIKGLCVKDSPAFDGDVRIWAAAVVGAIGYVNDLHDSKLEPHYTKATFLKKLDVDKQEYQAYLKVLIHGFDLIQYDPDFTLPSLLPMNPLIAMATSPTLLQEGGCCGGGCATSGCCNPAGCTMEGCGAAGCCQMEVGKKRK